MMNIVDNYTAETALDDEGVVAIEYVVVAAAVIAGLALIFGAFGGVLVARLNTIIGTI